MSRKLSRQMLVFLGLVVSSSSGRAQFYFEEPPPERGFGGKLDLNFASQYIWRGLEYNPEAVFQPSLRLNDRGFEVEVRGAMDLTDSNEHREDFTEWKYRVGLARRSRASDFSLSYIYYDYPEGEPSKTQELALEIAWGYPAMMGFDVYWDFDRARGFYGRTSLGYAWESGIFKLIPTVAIGYATSDYQEYYFDVPHNSFLDFVASLKLEVEFVSGISVVAEGLYYELVRGELRDSQRDRVRGERFWGGASLILRF